MGTVQSAASDGSGTSAGDGESKHDGSIFLERPKLVRSKSTQERVNSVTEMGFKATQAEAAFAAMPPNIPPHAQVCLAP